MTGIVLTAPPALDIDGQLTLAILRKAELETGRVKRAESVSKLAAALRKAEDAAKAERAAALIEDRHPDKSIVDAVAPVQAALDKARRELDDASLAVNVQADRIQGIRNEIAAGMRQRKLDRSKAPVEKLMKQQDAIAVLADDILHELVGCDLMPYEFFRGARDQTEAELRLRLLNASLELARYQSNFEARVA